MWVVDLGASNRIKGDATRFHKYSPSHDNVMVCTFDGSKVANIGSVIIYKDITLNSLLFV